MSRNELIILFLGFIAGISLCIIVYCWVIKPNLIKQWETRAINAKVAEYYDDLDGIQKFRYLTELIDE